MSHIRQAIRAQIKLWLRKGVYSSYSQGGEDLLVAGLLSEIKKGTYIDVGTYHPIQYSNTYFLYKKGWSGLVIDPNPQLKRLYRFFRPRDQFVNVGVGEVEGEYEYTEFSDGAFNTFDSQEAEARKKQEYPKFLGTKLLPLKTLATIVKDYGITEIDFMSIDVEGLDIQVLKSHNWKIPPKVIVIEDNTLEIEKFQESAAYQFLHPAGYTLMAAAARTLVFKRK